MTTPIRKFAADLHNLLGATDIATIFLDRDMRIVRFTPRVGELFNIRHTDRGRPLSDITHHLGYPELESDARNVLVKLVPIEREVNCVDGRYFLSRMLPYRSSDDRVEGVVITLIDITDRKAAESEMQAELAASRVLQEISTRLIPEGDPQALLDEILTAAIKISHADRGILQMLDPETHELLIASHQGFEADFLDSFQRIAANAGTDSTLSVERKDRIIAPDIEKSPFKDHAQLKTMLEAGIRALQSTPLISRSGQVLGVISTHWSKVHDPSERQLRMLDVLARQAADLMERLGAEAALRWNELNLRELSNSLEQRVAARTAELQAQAQRLQHLAGELATAEHRERKRLAAILHDELQQFLVAAKMRIATAQRRLKDDSLASTIQNALDAIEQALECSLDLARQLRPPVLYEDGLIPALRWLATEMKERHGLDVDLEAEDAPLPLNEDVKAMLYECVRELLFNVVKHAGVSSAKLRVKMARQRLTIEVGDSGSGFAVEAERARTGRLSSGIGLFSVGERLEALGGIMRVQSKPNEGTSVALEVPLTADSETTALSHQIIRRSPQQKNPQTSSNKPTVLVVDDHALVREGIANLLRDDGRVEVTGQSGDGIEAIELIERQQPDVVLIDVNMPRMNGIDATRQICRRWPHIKVMAMSVQSDEAVAQSMIEGGASVFVHKSEDAGRMVAEILRLVADRSTL